MSLHRRPTAVYVATSDRGTRIPGAWGATRVRGPMCKVGMSSDPVVRVKALSKPTGVFTMQGVRWCRDRAAAERAEEYLLNALRAAGFVPVHAEEYFPLDAAPLALRLVSGAGVVLDVRPYPGGMTRHERRRAAAT